MALPVFQRTITDDKGNTVSGASVRVRHEMAGTPNAKLYSDRDGANTLGNPATTDSAGFIRFYVASGAFRIDVTFGTTTITWRHVAIGLAAEKAGIAPGITWKFASPTADADPGSGFFRLNNSAASSATEMYISNNDANGVDQTTFLDGLDDGGGSADRGTLIVQGENADERLVIQVTGTVSEGGGSPSTYRKLSITVQSASLDDLTAGGVFGFLFSQDAAAGGATALDLGDDGANESSAIDEIATTGDTNSVFTNPTGDKLLIDLGNPVPFADTAAEAEDLAAGASAFDYLDFPEEPDQSPPDLPAADTMRLRARDDGAGSTELVAIDSAGNEHVLSRGGRAPDAIFEHQEASGTHGGTKSSGTETAPLNTEVRDVGNDFSLASDAITFPAGDYYVEAVSTTWRADNHQAWLYNDTDNAVLLNGTSEESKGSDNQCPSCSKIAGVISLADSKSIIIQHYSSSSETTQGFGQNAGSGQTNVYRRVKIWKL